MKEITGHLSPRYIKEKGEARTGKILETQTEIDHPVGRANYRQNDKQM